MRQTDREERKRDGGTLKDLQAGARFILFGGDGVIEEGCVSTFQ